MKTDDGLKICIDEHTINSDEDLKSGCLKIRKSN